MNTEGDGWGDYTGIAWWNWRKLREISGPRFEPGMSRIWSKTAKTFLSFPFFFPLSFLTFSILFFFCSLHSWEYAHIHFSPSMCTNRTTQHKRTETNIHVLSGIKTHAPNRVPLWSAPLGRHVRFYWQVYRMAGSSLNAGTVQQYFAL